MVEKRKKEEQEKTESTRHVYMRFSWSFDVGTSDRNCSPSSYPSSHVLRPSNPPPRVLSFSVRFRLPIPLLVPFFRVRADHTLSSSNYFAYLSPFSSFYPVTPTPPTPPLAVL